MKYYTTVRRRLEAPAVSTVFEEMQMAHLGDKFEMMKSAQP